MKATSINENSFPLSVYRFLCSAFLQQHWISSALNQLFNAIRFSFRVFYNNDSEIVYILWNAPSYNVLNAIFMIIFIDFSLLLCCSQAWAMSVVELSSVKPTIFRIHCFDAGIFEILLRVLPAKNFNQNVHQISTFV